MIHGGTDLAQTKNERAIFTRLIRLTGPFSNTLFFKKLWSGLSTQSFLAFCDFEYSEFLNIFF